MYSLKKCLQLQLPEQWDESDHEATIKVSKTQLRSGASYNHNSPLYVAVNEDWVEANNIFIHTRGSPTSKGYVFWYILLELANSWFKLWTADRENGACTVVEVKTEIFWNLPFWNTIQLASLGQLQYFPPHRQTRQAGSCTYVRVGYSPSNRQTWDRSIRDAIFWSTIKKEEKEIEQQMTSRKKGTVGKWKKEEEELMRFENIFLTSGFGSLRILPFHLLLVLV